MYGVIEFGDNCEVLVNVDGVFVKGIDVFMDGSLEGLSDGAGGINDGDIDGAIVGCIVGGIDGPNDGSLEGLGDGAEVIDNGDIDGCIEGAIVGCIVGAIEVIAVVHFDISIPVG